MNDYILSCDWGTSSFRLKLINSKTKENIGTVKSSQGIAKTFKASKEAINRFEVYTEYLHRQISELSNQCSQDLRHIPVFLSGMASSSIGMHELPYAQLPFHLSGEGLIWQKFEASSTFPHEIFLISGAQTDQDVMRGEEVQLLGLAKHLQDPSFISIFPGTHSKHICVEEHQIIDFKTYMTGEVFQLMVEHSILGTSVEKGGSLEANVEAFTNGVLQAVRSNLLHGLFTTRATELLQKTSKSYNYYYLSGLLIGYELRSLAEVDVPVFLCGGGGLSLLYEKAFQVLNLSTVQILSAEIVDEAVSEGHLAIAQKVL